MENISKIGRFHYYNLLSRTDREAVFEDFLKYSESSKLFSEEAEECQRIFVELLIISLKENIDFTIQNFEVIYSIWFAIFIDLPREYRLSGAAVLSDHEFNRLKIMVTKGNQEKIMDSDFVKDLSLELDLALWRLTPIKRQAQTTGSFTSTSKVRNCLGKIFPDGKSIDR